MFWSKKKKLEPYQDPAYAAEQMYKFLADVTALKPYMDVSPDIFKAYNTATDGLILACRDYCRTLQEQGFMSR